MENMQNIQKYAKFNLAEAVAKKTDFILENLLPLPIGKVSILSANGGMGKSALSLKCALDLAINENIKVLIHFSEDSLGEIKLRADELITMMNNKPYLSNIHLNDDSVMIQQELFTKEHYTNPLNIAEQKTLKHLFKGYKLVILDPLIGFINFDENLNGKAKEFISILTNIAKENEQAILLLHHHRKKSNDDETTTIRGASAFVDAVRVHYSLSYDKNTNKHIVKIEKDNLNAKAFFNGADTKPIQIFPSQEQDQQPQQPIKIKGRLCQPL